MGDSVKVGYACIESNVPVEATAIFQFVDQTGTPITEAGVRVNIFLGRPHG